MTLLRTATIIWLSLQAATTANAFIFRFTSTPSQCEGTSVVMQGGQAPYRLLLVPVGHQEQGVERRVIFDRTFGDRSDTDFTFPFPAGSQFVAVMSDATGFGTGGTSKILTVGDSGDSSCLPTSFSTPRFYFYLNTPTPSQCEPISISWSDSASGPVHIYGIIPQGDAFEVGRSSGDGFEWTADIRSGTPFMFVAGDSRGAGTGGSTDVTRVLTGAAGSACIRSDSPSTTPDTGNGDPRPLPGEESGGGGDDPDPTPTSGDEDDSPSPTQTSGDGGDGGDEEDGGEDGNESEGTEDSPSTETSVGSGSGTTTLTGIDGVVTTIHDGSGGGTVTGPRFPLPTDGAPISGLPDDDSQNHRSKLPLILGLVFGLLGLAALVILGMIWYRSRQKKQVERKTSIHHRRLLSNISEAHVNDEDGPVLLPPNSPYADPWQARSIESLGSAYRSTPFVWPRPGSMRNASSSSGFSPIGGATPGVVRRRGTGEVGPRPPVFPVQNDSSGSSGLPSSGIPSRKSDLPASYSRLRVENPPAGARPADSVSSSTRGYQGSHDGHGTYQPVLGPDEDFGEVVEQVLTPLTMAGRAFWGPRPPPPPRIPTSGSAMSEIPPTYTSLRRQSKKD